MNNQLIIAAVVMAIILAIISIPIIWLLIEDDLITESMYRITYDRELFWLFKNNKRLGLWGGWYMIRGNGEPRSSITYLTPPPHSKYLITSYKSLKEAEEAIKRLIEREIIIKIPSRIIKEVKNR